MNESSLEQVQEKIAELKGKLRDMENTRKHGLTAGVVPDNPHLEIEQGLIEVSESLLAALRRLDIQHG